MRTIIRSIAVLTYCLVLGFLVFADTTDQQTKSAKELEQELLRARNADAAIKAVEALHMLGREAKVAKATLVGLLDHEDSRVRLASATTILDVVEFDHKGALKALKQLLSTTGVRIAASKSAVVVGKTNPNVVALLMSIAINDKEDDAVRLIALRSIESLGEHAKRCVPDLVKCLDQDYPIAATAADALAGIGKSAGGAIPTLKKKIVADKSTDKVDLNVHRMARALAIIDNDNSDALTYFLRLLRNRDPELRAYGVNGMLVYRRLPAHIVEELRKTAASDLDPNVRRLAGQATKVKKD